MGYPKCALCGRGIKGRKRWLYRCFGGRKFPKLTVLRKHLPLSLAALLPGGGRPVMPKEPCLHDGSRGSATGCYAALLEAWHMQDDQTDQAAVLAPNTPSLLSAAHGAEHCHVRSAYTIAASSCFELLRHVPTGSVQFVCFDPPFGATRGSPTSKGFDRSWDIPWTAAEMSVVHNQLHRILAPGGHIAIFSANAFTQTIRTCFAPPGIGWYSMIWHHGDLSANTHNQDHQPAFTHEDITIFYKRSSIKELTLYNSQQRCNGTVLFHPKETTGQCRAMKPIPLIRELVRRYSSTKGVVMDICMNTGVCGKAALIEGRHFLGMELRLKQFEKAATWLAKSHMP